MIRKKYIVDCRFFLNQPHLGKKLSLIGTLVLVYDLLSYCTLQVTSFNIQIFSSVTYSADNYYPLQF